VPATAKGTHSSIIDWVGHFPFPVVILDIMASSTTPPSITFDPTGAINRNNMKGLVGAFILLSIFILIGQKKLLFF
jgi:hypothetical protein